MEIELGQTHILNIRCVLIMTDRSLGSINKIEELKKVKSEFAKPIHQKHSVIFNRKTESL